LVKGFLIKEITKTENMILASNSLISPAIGTIFWTVVIFILFFLILKIFAWKPILHAIKSRDEMIKSSLESAENARKEMLKLQSDNEATLRKAREEREGILKEARDVRDKLISEAKEKATDEAEKLVEKARLSIENEKRKAISEIQDQVTTMSIEIASKILGEKLKQTGEQEKLIDNYLKEINYKKN
jgi:F-type H+-transporting ATPase subunit b